MKLIIQGQVRGGKNNMIVCRNGMHIPSKTFKKWRDDAVTQIYHQIQNAKEIIRTIDNPCRADIIYTAGDRRRRDMPAIIDAIWHALERAEVVRDDCLIEDVCFKKLYDKENPNVRIILKEK